MNHIDTMKLALEALENSIDLVSNETREVEKMYANVPTRLARVQGLVAFEVAHEKAITALREALAQQALDKMAENARELGLDYEPVPENFMDALKFDVAMREAVEAEREAICDEWWMCVQSDLEHGVKSLNEQAAKDWFKNYPEIAKFGAWLNARRTHEDRN